MDTNGDLKRLLIKDLSARLPYGVKVTDGIHIITLKPCSDTSIIIKNEHILPYLRPMSSMTEEEKNELLIHVVGKEGVKYFRVLSDGSIDNTDATIQDLNRFNMHWINFDIDTVTAYIDWLNKKMFDYRGLIPLGLGIDCTGLNIYKNGK